MRLIVVFKLFRASLPAMEKTVNEMSPSPIRIVYRTLAQFCVCDILPIGGLKKVARAGEGRFRGVRYCGDMQNS